MGKWAKGALCLALALAASIGGYGYSATQSPEYALEQAAAAFAARDEMAFLRYVDEDALVESAYDEGARELAEHIGELRERYPEDFFFHHDTAFMLDYTKAHRADALRLIQGVRQAYFTGAEVPAAFEDDPPKWLAGEAAKFDAAAQGTCGKVERDGDRAVAEIRVSGDGSDYGQMADGLVFRLELRQQADGGWRIVRVANAKDLVFPITDSAERFWTVQGWQ